MFQMSSHSTMTRIEFKIISECGHDDQVHFLKCTDVGENGVRIMARFWLGIWCNY